MSLLVQIAAQFTGNKAFKEANKSITLLEGSARKLGATLGVSLSTAAVVAFGKASAKAFMEDEKSAAKLANTINNLGLGFANPVIATYISQLSQMTGVVDDDLRPAMQALIQQTGSLAKSQELLSLAISVSRGSGESLATVTNDLAQAYVGNTRGLRKYYLGLTQAELKTASFADVQARLTKQFSGANAAYLATYAGQMQLLTTAAGEAQETIGKGLIDSVILLGKDNSVEDLAGSMQDLADFTSNTVYGMASLVAELKKVGGAAPSWLKDFIGLSIGSIPGAGLIDAVKGISAYGAKKQNAKLPNSSVQMFQTDMANFRLGKEKVKTDKKIIASQKALTAEQKKQAALKKAGTIFDLEQINLIAALKGNLSKEERDRVLAQLALLTGNVTEAQKLTYEIAKAQGLGEQMARNLASLPAAKNPFEAWAAYLDMIAEKAKAIVTGSGGAGDMPSTNVPPTGSTDWAKGQDWWRQGGFGATSASAPAPVVVQIDGKTIASALMDQSLSGNQAYVNRRTGGFE